MTIILDSRLGVLKQREKEGHDSVPDLRSSPLWRRLLHEEVTNDVVGGGIAYKAVQVWWIANVILRQTLLTYSAQVHRNHEVAF